jgi:hypothetical protein
LQFVAGGWSAGDGVLLGGFSPLDGATGGLILLLDELESMVLVAEGLPAGGIQSFPLLDDLGDEL